MVKKPIIWSQRAKRERKLILQFWINNNITKDFALQLSSEFSKTTKYLSIYNHFGRLTDDKETRVILVNNYSLFYKIETDKIIILSVWNNRRNPADLDINV